MTGPATKRFNIRAREPNRLGLAGDGRQLERVGEIAEGCDGPVVVVGDLNITPFSPSFRRLCDAGRLRDARVGHGIQPSWPAGRWMLSIPIDHGLVSEHWRGVVSIGPDKFVIAESWLIKWHASTVRPTQLDQAHFAAWCQS